MRISLFIMIVCQLRNKFMIVQNKNILIWFVHFCQTTWQQQLLWLFYWMNGFSRKCSAKSYQNWSRTFPEACRIFLKRVTLIFSYFRHRPKKICVIIHSGCKQKSCQTRNLYELIKHLWFVLKVLFKISLRNHNQYSP